MSHEVLHTQIAYLESVLAKSKTMTEILKKTPDLRLPNWYVGAGAIAQTVWNELHGYPLDHGLKDCDLHDLLSMIVRPNKTLVSREVYEKKAQRWKSEWPMLEVITWDGMPH